MKKLLSGILASTFLLSVGTVSCVYASVDHDSYVFSKTLSNGYYTKVDGIGYWIEPSEGSASITNAFSVSDNHIEIPSSVLGYPVTSIGWLAFDGCENLESITIPVTVTYLESLAFTNTVKKLDTIYYLGTEKQANQLLSSYDEGDYEYNHWINLGKEDALDLAYPTWATTFIDFVSEDIMPDISPSNYTSASNRGLIAQSLSRMCGDGGTYTSNFTDVGENASAIGWCFANGVMAGSSGTWFNAEGNVTREQLALILRQLARVQGFDTSYDPAILSEYPDGTSGNDWAQSGLAWAVKNGLMSGNTDGRLNPMGNVSRVEVAVMLSNFVKSESLSFFD